MLILLSQISSFPSIETPNGLIYNKVESFYLKHLYNFGKSYFICMVKSYESSKDAATLSII